MNSTHRINTELNNNADDSNIPARVQPTCTLLIKSQPCEIQAARMRDKTVDSMLEGSIADVAFRYLQNKNGERSTFKEILSWSFMTICLFNIALSRNLTRNALKTTSKAADGVLGLSLLMVMLNIPPNLANTIRYRDTRIACENWLRSKLDSQTFNQIQALSPGREGFLRLKEILEKNNIETETQLYKRLR